MVSNDLYHIQFTYILGTQRSEIYCQEVDTKMKVPNSQCYGLSTEGLTPITKLCEQQPCPSEWVQSDILSIILFAFYYKKIS